MSLLKFVRNKLALKKPAQNQHELSDECRPFSLAEIQFATRYFDEKLLLGQGTYGKVYKGEIDGKDVAVKRLLFTYHREVEFQREIETTSKIRHSRLISLLGYCHDRDEEEFILIYEYMPNGTLHDHLHGRTSVLTWEVRLRICIGVAEGLCYLHDGFGSRKMIIHGDVKSGIVLLDKNFEPKISDFGLFNMIRSMLKDCTFSQQTILQFRDSDVTAEYLESGEMTKKLDVYSFGLLLLEVLCQEKAFNKHTQDCLHRGNFHGIVDPYLYSQMSNDCLHDFVDISRRCLNLKPNKRPTMPEVLVVLVALSKLEFVDDDGRGCQATEPELISAISESEGSSFPGKLSEISELISATSESEGYSFPWKLEILSDNGYGSPPAISDSEEVIVSEHVSVIPTAESILSEKKECHVYSLTAIKLATQKFDRKLLIGKGGFGEVYRGEMGNGYVAVKRLYYTLNREVEFQKEIETVSQIQHYRLISLIGHCKEEEERILVYEYMPNGSLDELLSSFTSLPWQVLLKICIGAADGLRHLHQGIGLHKIIIHGDVKGANILLDEDYEAKVSDFGSSVVFQTSAGHSYVQQTTLKLTKRYVDPLYEKTGKLTRESDVYSFGVLLLEVMCGEKAFDEEARARLKEGKYEGIIVKGLQEQLQGECLQKFLDISLECLHSERRKRPNMVKVLAALQGLDTSKDTSILHAEFSESNGRGYDTEETERLSGIPESEESSYYTLSANLIHETKKNFVEVAVEAVKNQRKFQNQGKRKELVPEDAAKVIQVAFKEFMIRRSQTLVTHQELAMGGAKLMEIKAIFSKLLFQGPAAHGTKERRELVNKMAELIKTVGNIEETNLIVRSCKRYMINNLKAMNELI